jgi:hypothetical protein
MNLIVLGPLVAALTAAAVAWHHATCLDRQSLQEGPPADANGSSQWRFALGAVVIAVLAVTALQTILLTGLRLPE